MRAPEPDARRRGLRTRVAAAALATLALAAPGWCAARAPFPARAGLATVVAAAAVWAPDAVLTYVENDEPLDATGGAVRWGYLFCSATLRKARAYSVREGRIVVAEPLEMSFDAPPVAAPWIDSAAALAAAEAAGGRAFRREHGGQPGAMLLTRGAFDDDDPDRTTWTVVYTSPSAPSLFVVVDAAVGKVRRMWRG